MVKPQDFFGSGVAMSQNFFGSSVTAKVRKDRSKRTGDFRVVGSGKASGCVRKGTMRGPRLSTWRLFPFMRLQKQTP